MNRSDYQKLRFEGEENGEETLFFLRPHAITNLGWIWISIFLVLFSSGTAFFLINNSLFEIPLENSSLVISSLAFDLMIAGGSLLWFIHWYFNIYILTTRRLVDIDFYGLFSRKVSQTALRNIEDVTYTKKGIWQNFFDYGDIHVQTAGTKPNFEFHAIADPEGSVQFILDLVTKSKNGVLEAHGTS